MDLTISIVSYNTKDLLRNCLNSIYKNIKGIKFEVIVVDNGSKDDSIKMLKREFPQVKLIINKNNLGFAKANNQAIKESKGKYILLLNSDTVILSDAINKMVNFIKIHPEAGAVGCTKLNPDLSPQPSVTILPNMWIVFLRFFRLKRFFPSCSQRRFLIKFFGSFLGKTITSYLSWYSENKLEKAIPVDFITGACFLIRRETIDEVGLLDENFFMYLEDADWCFRIRQRGWKMYICPEAKIIHYGGENFRSNVDAFSLDYCRSRYYYFDKHYGEKYTFLIRLIISFALILKEINLLFLYLFSRKNVRKILRKRFNLYLEIIKFNFSIKGKEGKYVSTC